MTVIVAVLACLLSMSLARFGMDLSAITSRRAQAQIAADAAALASVAEAAPYGRGLELHEARRFAELNGAELLECRCADAATVVQVEVVVDGVTARARAVLDPAALFPVVPSASMAGHHPSLSAALRSLFASAGGRVRVVSGSRSSEAQAALWTQALRRYGDAEAADDWVAPPGSSMHEKGLAVDLGGDLTLAARLVADLSLPLYRPLPHEPWHFELLGSRS
ncbi:MAG: D-alanyl-D-alanine carboxypeptidase family protein [Actinomycetota bacterium]|nr:D-alanyl-D-alanine carboxypeptidase family protein [Actinomycetota bacterium]